MNDFTRSRRLLYRSRNNRYIAGVCGGLAEHFDFSSAGVRVLFALLTLMFLPVMILLYIVLAILLPVRASGGAESMFCEHDAQPASPEDALAGARERFDALDRRLQRLESIVTSREFELESQYKEL